MSKITEAVALIRKIAADNTHGYDQAHRWGTPDFDCSSLVISVWQSVGVPVRTNGATYTGNMRPAFLKSGFSDVTAAVNLRTGEGLQAGDVLLNIVHHTAMMISPTMLAQACINEQGGIKGGKPGDQTGGEIGERRFYVYPWDCCLRYTAEIEECEVSLPVLQKGDRHEAVKALKALLIMHGLKGKFAATNTLFGTSTKKAVIKFQAAHGLDEDGIVGQKTWGCLLGVS